MVGHVQWHPLVDRIAHVVSPDEIAVLVLRPNRANTSFGSFDDDGDALHHRSLIDNSQEKDGSLRTKMVARTGSNRHLQQQTLVGAWAVLVCPRWALPMGSSFKR